MLEVKSRQKAWSIVENTKQTNYTEFKVGTILLHSIIFSHIQHIPCPPPPQIGVDVLSGEIVLLPGIKTSCFELQQL